MVGAEEDEEEEEEEEEEREEEEAEEGEEEVEKSVPVVGTAVCEEVRGVDQVRCS